jgi:hypothetical protein
LAGSFWPSTSLSLLLLSQRMPVNWTISSAQCFQNKVLRYVYLLPLSK